MRFETSLLMVSLPVSLPEKPHNTGAPVERYLKTSNSRLFGESVHLDPVAGARRLPSANAPARLTTITLCFRRWNTSLYTQRWMYDVCASPRKPVRSCADDAGARPDGGTGSAASAQIRLLVRRSSYAPDRVRQIVSDDQGAAAGIDRHAHGPAAGLAVLADEARQHVDRRSRRTAVAEGHEHHLVANRRLPVPAAVLADEDAVGKFASHRGRGECDAERGDVRSQAVVGTSGGRNELRILGLYSRVDVLAPIAVWPALESAVLDGGQIIRDEVGAEFIAFVGDRPQLVGAWLVCLLGWVARSGGVGPVRAGLGVDLPDPGALDLGQHAALGNVAIGADADID